MHMFVLVHAACARVCICDPTKGTKIFVTPTIYPTLCQYDIVSTFEPVLRWTYGHVHTYLYILHVYVYAIQQRGL